MPRLRTTTTLSLVALAAGIAGTGWLSTLTSQWPEMPVHPVQRVASHPAVPAVQHSRLRVTRFHQAVTRMTPVHSVVIAAKQPSATPPPELIPLSMPADDSQPWRSLQGHLDGHVLMHLHIDGNGRVSAARVATSSGDPVLDQHAVRSVRGWRFAVPADHPAGFEGELPMRFAAADRQPAAAP